MKKQKTKDKNYDYYDSNGFVYADYGCSMPITEKQAGISESSNICHIANYHYDVKPGWH